MAAVIEVKVPDIGDFKDVPVIEVMVKAGDRVKPEDSLVSLESDKATMDVPAPVGGLVNEVKVKVGDKVSEGALILLLDTGTGAAAGPAAPRAEDLDRGAARGHECARRNRRSARAGHRRFQGRAGHRNHGEAGRRGEGRGRPRLARIREGDDGCAGAALRQGAGDKDQGRRQGLRRHVDHDAGHRQRGRIEGGGAHRRSTRTCAPRQPRRRAGGRHGVSTRPRSRLPTPVPACASSRASSASTSAR